MKLRLLIVAFLLQCCFQQAATAQDSTSIYSHVLNFPDKLLSKIHKRSALLDKQLTSQTEKALHRLARQEQRLKKQLQKSDSLKAKRIFNNSPARYEQMEALLKGQPLKTPLQNNGYNGHLDSLQTALRFLGQANGGSQAAQVQLLVKQYGDLQNRLNQTAEIQQYLEDRKRYLKAQLQGTELAKSLRGYKEQLYYYKTALEQYKDAWEQPEKYESQLLNAVNKMPSFHDFFSHYSQIAALFPTPAGYGTTQSIAGLQTSNNVQGLIQQQIAAGGPDAANTIQQNLQAAQSALGTLKDRISKWGNAGADLDKEMEKFNPNPLKTKSFLQRLEYGFSCQSQHATYYFPTTSDIAVQLGYRFTAGSTAGIGLGYKMGWGRDIQHITLSHQGLSIRSFYEMKISKPDLWVSGGIELNYLTAFHGFSILDDFTPWQKSALFGLIKKYKAGKKLKGNIQLLYDFLWRRQVPAGQPLVFRLGYSLH